MSQPLPATRESTQLEPVSAARQVIARAVVDHDWETLLELRQRASAFELYNQRNGAREVANDAGEIKVRAERGLGAVDAEANPRGRPEKSSGGPEVFRLDVHQDTRAAWRKLGQMPDDEFENRLEEARNDEHSGISTARVLGKLKNTAEKLVASNENEWYTPRKYIEPARTVLGTIDLDPASCATANATVQATSYYDASIDGIDKPWNGNVWLNPPYGRLAGDFIGRLVREHTAGTVPAAIALINAHCTDTNWFQPLWDYHLCFTDHRIDFDSGDRTKTTSSTHGSVFVYLGDNHQAFVREFSPFGAVVRRA